MARKRISDGIETGHRAFDRQANASIITVGNVMSDVQFSSYVRSREQLECNGFVNAPQHLQDFDIRQFRRSGVPAEVERVTRRAADDNGGAILYRFGYWVGPNRDPRRIHLGWVVTDRQHQLVAAFPASTPKASRVIDEVLAFVAAGK